MIYLVRLYITPTGLWIVVIMVFLGTIGEGLAADVNGDGVVDIVDLVIVAKHFGEKTGTY